MCLGHQKWRQMHWLNDILVTNPMRDAVIEFLKATLSAGFRTKKLHFSCMKNYKTHKIIISLQILPILPSKNPRERFFYTLVFPRENWWKIKDFTLFFHIFQKINDWRRSLSNTLLSTVKFSQVSHTLDRDSNGHERLVMEDREGGQKCEFLP